MAEKKEEHPPFGMPSCWGAFLMSLIPHGPPRGRALLGRPPRLPCRKRVSYSLWCSELNLSVILETGRLPALLAFTRA